MFITKKKLDDEFILLIYAYTHKTHINTYIKNLQIN